MLCDADTPLSSAGAADTMITMETVLIYEHLERISHLLRADARRAGDSNDLQPVQLDALHYLSICNAYSNTPAAVADYLGLTKGTVSQTLRVLENRGYIEKQPDTKDRRVVHLWLTAKGTALVDGSIPPKSLENGIARLSASGRQQLSTALCQLLEAMQQANQLRPFGVCIRCRHNTALGDTRFRCELTQELLGPAQEQRICREHQCWTGENPVGC